MQPLNASSCFCIPPPGKPNPNEPSHGTIRSRVKQNPQKGETCTYYALQILRNEHKIGKCPSNAQLIEREYEKLFSDYRKCLTTWLSLKMDVIHFSRELKELLGEKATLSGGFRLIVQKINAIPNQEDKRGFLKHKPFIEAFCSQDTQDDPLIFATELYQQTRFEAGRLLLDKLGNNFNEEVERLAASSFAKSPNALTIHEKLHVQTYYIEILQEEIYKIKKSSWHPEQPIESLIAQLKTYGPHVVKGRIGQGFYENPPFQPKNTQTREPTYIQGRPVFGWSPNNKFKDPGCLHTVVMVGAEKTASGKEYVYFLDPNDGSDPVDITSQKLYVLSYERLRSQIAKLSSIIRERIEEAPSFVAQDPDGNNPYAWHMR